MGRFQMTVMNQGALTWGSADGRDDLHSPADIPVKMHGWLMLLCIVGIGNVFNWNPNFITLFNIDTHRNGPPSKERSRNLVSIIQVIQEEGNVHHTVDQQRLGRAFDGC